MRNALIKCLTELAKKDPKIQVLVADIGVYLFTQAGFPPKQLTNCGISEQNMIGVAAGMALKGLIPFCYTITPFATARCYDQIRYSVAYQNLPVTIIGIGAGVDYSKEGPSHHAIEDIAIMRALPNMRVYSPARPSTMDWLIHEIIELKKPSYIRVSLTSDEFNIPESQGNDIAIMATGRMVKLTLQACENMLVDVYDISRIKPLQLHVASKTFITVEDHNIIGGLGDAVSMAFPDSRVIRIGIPDKFCSCYGSVDYVLKSVGLDVDSLRERIKQIVDK